MLWLFKRWGQRTRPQVQPPVRQNPQHQVSVGSPIGADEARGAGIPTRQSSNPAGIDSTGKPALLTKTTTAPLEDVTYLKGIGQEAQVWTTYVKETKEFDDDMVEGWNRNLDVTLVFAALFSAILTAFVLESAKKLEPDPASQTVDILLEISRALQVNGGAVQPIVNQTNPQGQSPFRPSTSTVWINCLWFLSLSLSIAVSLAAMLAKQWCYYYVSFRSGDTITQAEDRQKRYDGLARWRMRGILEHLPMLMHISLALFSVGLILYLWNINVAIASTVSAVTISALFCYLVTVLLPVWDSFCPFKTTQAVYARVFLKNMIRRLPKFQPLLVPVSSASLHSAIGYMVGWFTEQHVRQPNPIRPDGPRNEPRPALPNTEGDSHVIYIPSVLSDNHSSTASSSSTSDDETKPFVKGALEWLILYSQKSSSIDTAIAAIAIGKVPVENKELKHHIYLHLVKHFCDCFTPKQEGFSLHLSRRNNALGMALDYINWMSCLSNSNHELIKRQLLELKEALEPELVTRFGLSLASLAQNRTLPQDAGKHIAYWLSAFVICYDESGLYFHPDVLSLLVQGLAITGRCVHNAKSASKRAVKLAIPQLISILWKVSHLEESELRSSIGLNLSVFALTTGLPYPIQKHNFKSTADFLAYDYRPTVLKERTFAPFGIFALLGILLPESRVDLGDEKTEIATRIIHETKYLEQPNLSLDIPKLVGQYSFRRHMSSMVIENMVQSSVAPLNPRRYLLYMVYKNQDVARRQEQSAFPTLIHALHHLVEQHLDKTAVLHEDIIVAATDLLHREVQKLQRLDSSLIGFETAPEVQTASLTPGSQPDARDDNPSHREIENLATQTLARILERSNNKQCLEAAVRAVIFHTGSCDVGLVLKAIAWFVKSFGGAQYEQDVITEDQMLHMCGYIRILISMAVHCPDPSGLAESLYAPGRTDYDAIMCEMIQANIHTLETRSRDPHVKTFGIVCSSVWKFTITNQTFSQQDTYSTFSKIWHLLISHAEALPKAQSHDGIQLDHMIRPEVVEALVDATVLVASSTEAKYSVSHVETQALLSLLGYFGDNPSAVTIRLALAVAIAFWSLSLETGDWEFEFWSLLGHRKEWCRHYLKNHSRSSDAAALLLLGLSRILSYYEQLRLSSTSIKTIASEIHCIMKQHEKQREPLTLGFLNGYDVRRQVRESVWRYLRETESEEPISKSTSMSRDTLRAALQCEGGEGFVHEQPQPFRRISRGVSFSSGPVYNSDGTQAADTLQLPGRISVEVSCT